MVEEHTSFGMNILEPISPSIYKFKKVHKLHLYTWWTLNLKNPTLSYTQAATQRETDKGGERERERRANPRLH